MSWWDLRVLVDHLPSDSHLRRAINPEVPKRDEALTITNQVLGLLYDAIAGIPEEGPGRGLSLTQRILDQATGLAEEKPAPTASAIRAQVAAAFTD